MSTRLLGVLAVVAVLVAAWFGWSWWRTAHDDFASGSRDRDAVLAAASDALVALNSVDYRDAGPAVDRWTAGRRGSAPAVTVPLPNVTAAP